MVIDIGCFYVINDHAWICWSRDLTGYGLNQWKTALQCNVVSHWLSPYPEWSHWPQPKSNTVYFIEYVDCVVVVLVWFGYVIVVDRFISVINPYHSGHHKTASVQVKQPWRIWIISAETLPEQNATKCESVHLWMFCSWKTSRMNIE